MKKYLSVFLILFLSIGIYASASYFVLKGNLAFAAGKTETLTFQWDQDDTTNLKEWRLYWSDVAGGPYDETPVAVIAYDSNVGGPIYSGDATTSVVGEQGTTLNKYFVLVACGDIPQEDGSTQYECSENSNEVAHGFWIPAGKFSVPINFRVLEE